MLLLVAVLPKGTFFGRGELGWFEGARERKPIHPAAKASRQAGRQAKQRQSELSFKVKQICSTLVLSACIIGTAEEAPELDISASQNIKAGMWCGLWCSNRIAPGREGTRPSKWI